MNFYLIMSAIIVICGGITATFFKKGGIYNPHEEPEPTDPPVAPTSPVVKTLDTPLPPQPPIDRIHQFALAQQSFEGYWPGSSSYTHRNPGNIRDLSGNFITFPTYEAGLLALEDYIRRVIAGKHKAYPRGGETTIMSYTHVYTGDPEPSPTNYAIHLAKAVSLSTGAKMKELLPV